MAVITSCNGNNYSPVWIHKYIEMEWVDVAERETAYVSAVCLTADLPNWSLFTGDICEHASLIVDHMFATVANREDMEERQTSSACIRVPSRS